MDGSTAEMGHAASWRRWARNPKGASQITSFSRALCQALTELVLRLSGLPGLIRLCVHAHP